MKKKGSHFSLVLIVLGLIVFMSVSFPSRILGSNEETYLTKECPMENADRNIRLQDLERENARLTAESIKTTIERDSYKDKYQEVAAAYDRIHADLQYFTSHMVDQKVDEKALDAIVDVRIKFNATAADFTRVLGRGMSFNEIMNTEWTTFGTVIDMGELGNKVVIMRHALYGGTQEGYDTLKFMTVSVIEPTSRLEYAISLQGEGFIEIPELDLVALDVPSALQSKPLPIGDVDFYRTPIVSQIYPDEFSIHSQFVPIRPVTDVLSSLLEEEGLNDSDNFMYVSGRIIYGDSGGPLILQEEGAQKVVGFIMAKSVDKDGGGLAVKASALREKFSKTESQRPRN